MTTWTEELKKHVISEYLAAEPTAETSTEIVKQIAEDLEVSPNGVRQVLVQAEVYVKKDAVTSTAAKKTTSTSNGEGGKRVSKEAQHDALKAAITAFGGAVDEEIISKLTGKAAAYFTGVLNKGM